MTSEHKKQFFDNLLLICRQLNWDMAVPDQEYGGGGIIFGMPEYVDTVLRGLPEGMEHSRYKPDEEILH